MQLSEPRTANEPMYGQGMEEGGLEEGGKNTKGQTSLPLVPLFLLNCSYVRFR